MATFELLPSLSSPPRKKHQQMSLAAGRATVTPMPSPPKLAEYGDQQHYQQQPYPQTGVGRVRAAPPAESPPLHAPARPLPPPLPADLNMGRSGIGGGGGGGGGGGSPPQVAMKAWAESTDIASTLALGLAPGESLLVTRGAAAPSGMAPRSMGMAPRSMGMSPLAGSASLPTIHSPYGRGPGPGGSGPGVSSTGAAGGVRSPSPGPTGAGPASRVSPYADAASPPHEVSSLRRKNRELR